MVADFRKHAATIPAKLKGIVCTPSNLLQYSSKVLVNTLTSSPGIIDVQLPHLINNDSCSHCANLLHVMDECSIDQGPNLITLNYKEDFLPDFI